MFSTDIALIVWILCAVMIFIAVLSIFWLWRPMILTARAARDSNCDDESAPQRSDISLSLILYAENDDIESTAACVESLRAQSLQNFEIVVVCRATAEHRDMLAGRLADMPGIYVTFIPPGSHNLSERKLAITLGLKAAKGNVVLTTTTNIIPPSDRWLSQMVAPFDNPDVELVIGYSHQDFSEIRGAGRWYKQFYNVMGAAQWLGAALARNPYRGDGYNLAFRRETFFEHKGYARNIYLHYGDDDLFVNEIATPENTRVVIASDTQLSTVWGSEANRIWTMRRERYMFTSRWLPKYPFFCAALLSANQWIVTACCVASILLGLPSLLPLLIAAPLWIAFQIAQIYLYRPLARSLYAVRLWWAVPLFLHIRPINNFLFRIAHRSMRKKFFTWKR